MKSIGGLFPQPARARPESKTSFATRAAVWISASRIYSTTAVQGTLLEQLGRHLIRHRLPGLDEHLVSDTFRLRGEDRHADRREYVPIAASHKTARSILLSEDALRSSDILLERRLRLLNDADVVAIFDKNVVNAFPARAICPGTVNQNNIPNTILFVQR